MEIGGSGTRMEDSLLLACLKMDMLGYLKPVSPVGRDAR